MGYTSGHYRKGHFRNGKWVSGGYVKGHYRSGSCYGSGMYSTNTTLSNDKQNDSHEFSNTYLDERRAYWKRIKEEEGSAPKLDNSKDSNSDTSKTILISIVVVGIIVGIIIIIDSSVGGSGDGTLGNWFLAILVILALLKKR